MGYTVRFAVSPLPEEIPVQKRVASIVARAATVGGVKMW